MPCGASISAFSLSSSKSFVKQWLKAETPHGLKPVVSRAAWSLYSSVVSLKSDEEMHPTCEAGGSIEPGVERSGTPGLIAG
jgi:hypothetical protein